VRLSAEAVERFEQFRQFAHSGKNALDGREREWWSKIPAHVLRLAGTLCFLDWSFIGGSEPTAIDAGHIEAAIKLVREFFWPHARACLRLIGLSDRHQDARRALRWLLAKRKTEVSREDTRRDALIQKLDAEETERLLQDLEKAGWVKKDVEHHGPQGGRPTTRWHVNPALLGTAETAGTAET
jgi:hypothetical protein